MQNLSYDLRCTLSSLGCIPVARKMFFLTGIRVRPSIIPGDLLYALLQARVLHYLHSVQPVPTLGHCRIMGKQNVPDYLLNAKKDVQYRPRSSCVSETKRRTPHETCPRCDEVAGAGICPEAGAVGNFALEFAESKVTQFDI